ncbi:redoxin domain-containing protein [bacterium]|nr:redoxin domain-containing protein [bacterium]MCB2179031.1 redoxin domain-containing protein [bacterium]
MRQSKLLVVLLLVALIAAGCATSSDEGIREAPEVGALAPRFTLANTYGNNVSLEDYRGKVVLINFWATWCPPCRQEMPTILDRYEGADGDLIVLAVDYAEPADLVIDFQEQMGLTFNVLLDERGSVSDLYRIQGYPTSVFVNEQGVIDIVHIGLMTEKELDGYLEDMGLAVAASDFEW